MDNLRPDNNRPEGTPASYEGRYRQYRKDKKAEYERISNIRRGIESGNIINNLSSIYDQKSSANAKVDKNYDPHVVVDQFKKIIFFKKKQFEKKQELQQNRDLKVNAAKSFVIAYDGLSYVYNRLYPILRSYYEYNSKLTDNQNSPSLGDLRVMNQRLLQHLGTLELLRDGIDPFFPQEAQGEKGFTLFAQSQKDSLERSIADMKRASGNDSKYRTLKRKLGGGDSKRTVDNMESILRRLDKDEQSSKSKLVGQAGEVLKGLNKTVFPVLTDPINPDLPTLISNLKELSRTVYRKLEQEGDARTLSWQDAYEHARAVEHSREILKWMEKLQTCEPSQRPEVLANFLIATYPFPRSISSDSSNMPASEKLADLIKDFPPGRFFQYTPYIAKDLERGGPVARLVAHEQKFREARGLTSTVLPDDLFEIYNKEYQNMYGADKSIEDLGGFLQAVGELDNKLRGRTTALSPTTVLMYTGIERAPYIEDLPIILHKFGFPENGGTFLNLGDPGWDTWSTQKATTKARISFAVVHAFDSCTEEQASRPDKLIDYRSPRHDDFIPTDEDIQELARMNRHFKCDLTKVKLTERINDVHELPEPIVYTMDNFLNYYGRKGMVMILGRLRDIPNALGREPASLLHVSYGFENNRPLMGRLFIDLTTGRLVRADNPKLNLRGNNVRGPKDQPFEITEHELVGMITEEREAIINERKQFSPMSDEHFEQLCEAYNLVTEK